MKKSQAREWAYKGQITAFLALVFVLMLAVIGALFESASIHIRKNNLRANTMLATESVFAEYDRGLLEQYGIFARVGKEEKQLQERLKYYGADGTEHSIKEIQLLSDFHGKSLYEQGIKYAKSWTGLQEFFFEKDYDFGKYEGIEDEKNKTYQTLDTLLKGEEVSLPNENNPLALIDSLKGPDLLTWIVTDTKELSGRSIHMQDLASQRALESGNYKMVESNSDMEKPFFILYLTHHFSSKTNENEERELLYEIEYLLEGANNDRENLQAVCQKLMLIRSVANYGYLLTDSTKQGEAEVLAAALCTAVSVPEITEAVKQALLFAWAYGESLVDVRCLLKGNRTPFVKTKETWQLSINQLCNLKNELMDVKEKNSEKGLKYTDYLIGFLLLESRETLCMRGLDLIENHLGIRSDCCMTKVKIQSEATLQRGVKETFTTTFGYR